MDITSDGHHYDAIPMLCGVIISRGGGGGGDGDDGGGGGGGGGGGCGGGCGVAVFVVVLQCFHSVGSDSAWSMCSFLNVIISCAACWLTKLKVA